LEFLSASLLVAELTLLEEFELHCTNVTEVCTGRLQPAVVGCSLLPAVQRGNGAGTGRQIKVVLLARECGNGFSSHLLEALLGLRGPPQEESGVSSAESVYGCQVNSMPTPASEVSSREILPPSLPEPRATRRLTGEQASSGLSKNYSGCLTSTRGGVTIVSQCRTPAHTLPKSYNISEAKKVEMVAVDHLKPH
jgi:hypothetical protein